MKPLKPSLRERKRYMKISGHIDEIEKSILDFSGVLGLGRLGLKFIEKNKNNAIISINRESVDIVRASFVVWPKDIRVERVSGTLKGVRAK